jgi:hypothetical protein
MTVIVPVNHETDSVDQLQRLDNKLDGSARGQIRRFETPHHNFSIKQ